MNRLKKNYLFAIVLSLLFVLAACGGGGTSEPSSGGNDNAKDAAEQGDSTAVEVQGVTDDEILIGHIGPQTGATAIYDLVRKGIDSHFNYVNENGGVNGRQLKLVAYDDQYQPAQAVQGARKLVEEDKVYAMLGNVGATSVNAYQDYLIEKEMPLVLMSAAAISFFEEPIDVFLGSGLMNYRLEALVYLDYAINELNGKSLAIAYQNDDFGSEGYTAVKEAVDSYDGVEIVEEVTFLPSDTEFSAQSQQLNAANPDVIFYFGSPNPAANLKKELFKTNLADTPFIVSSVANDNNLFELAGADVWDGTYSGAVFQNIELVKDEDEQVQLFVERFGGDYPNDPLSGFAQYGWAEAQVLVEALERMGDDLSYENLQETLYTFDQWEDSLYEGVTLTADNHFGITSMLMTQATDGEIRPISGSISVDPKTKEITYND